MPKDSEREPEKKPNSDPQPDTNKPLIVIPEKPRQDLIDYQTEGYDPKREKKDK
jgi:hypothetical protein